MYYIRVLVYYETPVAAWMPDGVEGPHFIKTAKKWSATTSKHINKWLAGASADEVPQERIEAILG